MKQGHSHVTRNGVLQISHAATYQ